MKLFVAGLATETNTFAPIPTDRRSFARTYYPPGSHPATPTMSGAVLVVARRLAAEQGLTLVEGSFASANPAGTVARATYEELRDEILGQLRAAMPVDVILFGLHGAMVAHGYDDCEGDLLARARAIAPDAVIGGEIDPHAHLTDAMVHAADFIVAFKEFPHTDFLARAEDLAALCLAKARGQIKPHACVFDMLDIGGFMTGVQPGRGFVDRMLAMEGQGGIRSISAIHGFQAADVYDVGSKMLVYADDRATGEALAERLGRELLSWGRSGNPVHLKTAEAVADALATPGQPVVLADRWDNPGGGVAGDSTFLIEELMKHPEVPAAVGALWDARR